MSKKLLTIIIALSLVFYFSNALTVYADTAGYTSIGASNYITGTSGATNPPGLLITVTSAGTMTKVTAYVGNTVSSNSPTVSLYSGSAGARGSLIATTNSNTVTTSFGWVDFTFATPQSVSATTYWIQFNGDGGNGPGGNRGQIRYDTGGGANTSYTLSDVGVPSYSTNQYSMYATYTPDPVGQTSHANAVIRGDVIIGSGANVVIQ